MTVFLCTTGTSIASKTQLDLDHLKGKLINKWNEYVSDLNIIKKEIVKRFSDIDFFQDYNKASAEIKSLVKMGLSKEDMVVFLYSETIDGRLCAEVNQELLEKHIGCEVQIELIKGLQAENGKYFVKHGIKSLFNVLTKYLEKYYQVIINPTGGYKSTVPYMALAGMLYKKPVKYIHEESEDMITLSNLPIVWDEDLLLRIEDKLRKIEQEGVIPKEEWLAGIDYNDPRYESLIEEDEEGVTLSGIGYFFYEKFKLDYPPELLRDQTPARKKKIKLSDHHGKDRLMAIAQKIIKSPFVTEIVTSMEYKPKEKVYIKPLKPEETNNNEHNLCIFTDIKSDAGYSFLLKTTARNEAENRKIAELLNKKYFL